MSRPETLESMHELLASIREAINRVQVESHAASKEAVDEDAGAWGADTPDVTLMGAGGIDDEADVLWVDEGEGGMAETAPPMPSKPAFADTGLHEENGKARGGENTADTPRSTASFSHPGTPADSTRSATMTGSTHLGATADSARSGMTADSMHAAATDSARPGAAAGSTRSASAAGATRSAAVVTPLYPSARAPRASGAKPKVAETITEDSTEHLGKARQAARHAPVATSIPTTEVATDAAAASRLSPAVQARVKNAMARMERIEAARRALGGERALRQLVSDLVEPLVREWLQENLADIVERQVEREIAHITHHPELHAKSGTG